MAVEARKAKKAADKEEPDDSNASKRPGVFLSAEDKEQLGQKESIEQMQRDHELMLSKVQARDEPDRFRVPVYAWDAPVKLLAGRKTNPDRETRDRDKRLFEQLRALGALRRVCAWTQMDTVLDGLRALRASQPHFSLVVDLIDARLRLAQVRDEPARIPPILLAGPPGVGKTHFTLELARVLQRPMRRHSFDASHTASALMGSDRNWANTRWGLLFDVVCLGERADPIILLDELDKAAEHSYRGSPLAPLHSLLEPVTSASVTDISVGLQFDASHVFYVATANDLRLVSPPIQSRFQVFHIELPNAEQSIELAQAVAAAVHARYCGFEAPPRRLVTLLAHLTPREQIQILDQAYSQAVVNGRKNLMRQDLPAELLQDNGAEPTIGRFLH